jgi:integrase
MRDALIVAKKLGLTQKSRHRDRRPTLDELDRLMTHFLDRSIRRPSSVPMHRVMAFAIFSTRRQEEITRIKWADLDQDGKRVLVRDMKNPGEKIGNDVWCDIPDPALAIIEAMPRHSDRIFPYSTDAISGPVSLSCRPTCSFKPPFARKRQGFSSPMLNAGGADCKSR